MATTILNMQTLIVPAWLNIAEIDIDYDIHDIVTFKSLPVSELCLANGLSEEQFSFHLNGVEYFSDQPEDRSLSDAATERAVALALIWMDRHTQGEYSRLRGYAPLSFEFAVASHINLALEIPDGLDFSTLNLHSRQPGGQPHFNDLAIQLLCLKNGIDYEPLSGWPVSGITDLIFSWYILHRRAGGVTNPFLEGVIQRGALCGMSFTLKRGMTPLQAGDSET